MVSSGYMYDVSRDETYLNNLKNSTFPSFSHHTPPLSYMRSFLFNQLGIGWNLLECVAAMDVCRHLSYDWRSLFNSENFIIKSSTGMEAATITKALSGTSLSPSPLYYLEHSDHATGHTTKAQSSSDSVTSSNVCPFHAHPLSLFPSSSTLTSRICRYWRRTSNPRRLGHYARHH